MARNNFVATVKEFRDGQPWLVLEMHKDIGLGNTQIGLHFEKGTTYDQAKEVARFINDRVSEIRLHP